MGICPRGALTASEICSNDVALTELREVLASALFSFQSPDVLVWTNWSYAEFLAASWCISRQSTTASIRNLISVVGDQGTGIPQQLSSTALWIGELRPELQRYLVELNPSLLLFIDEGAVETSILRRLVKHSIERRRTTCKPALAGLLIRPSIQVPWHCQATSQVPPPREEGLGVCDGTPYCDCRRRPLRVEP